MFADFTMGHALFYYFLVTLIALPILFLSWLGQKYRIEKMRNELQMLKKEQWQRQLKIKEGATELAATLQKGEKLIKELQHLAIADEEKSSE